MCPECTAQIPNEIVEQFGSAENFKEQFRAVKHGKKLEFIDYVNNTFDTKLESHSLYGTQVKRLHAYKRQTLNILYVMHLYNQILENPDIDMQPRTFVFGAKAFSSYSLAKRVIKLTLFIFLSNNFVFATPCIARIFINNISVLIVYPLFGQT